MRGLGWFLAALGVLLLTLGASAAVVLGPDSRFTTGPHPIETSGTVVVTQPGVISWRGLQVDVLAEVPANKPVFVGLGNSVDVADYVSETERVEVSSFERPWELTTDTVDGQPGLPGAPTALDWWIAGSAGLGGSSISVTLPDETTSLAVVAVGATNLSGLEVTLAYGPRGGFATALGVALLGAGVLLAGVVLLRGGRVTAETPDDELEVVEEIVYVVVEDDGTEREISAEEAQALGLVEDLTTDDDEVTGADPMPDDPTIDDLTPGDTADGQDVAAPAETPVADAPERPTHDSARADADPSPVPVEEDVVYVVVDEDGVEHEISADELDAYDLDEYELVDDDEEDRR